MTSSRLTSFWAVASTVLAIEESLLPLGVESTNYLALLFLAFLFFLGRVLTVAGSPRYVSASDIIS